MIHRLLRYLSACPAKRLPFGGIVEEKKGRVFRQLAWIPKDRNGGIASRASRGKEQRNTITQVGRRHRNGTRGGPERCRVT